MPKLLRVETLLPEKDVEAIDTFVEVGAYATRTDLVRTAVKKLLYSEEKVEKMERAFELVEKRLKKLGIRPREMLDEFEKRESAKKVEEMIAHAKARKHSG